jgi:streptomycin 6-kinase
VAGLYPRLHVPAPGRLRPLTHHVERWTDAMVDLGDELPVPRRLVGQAASLARSFLTDEGSTGTLVHTDLHYENVLAAAREPWLVIDPKPVSGDPHYEVGPLLWNRWPEVVRSGRVREEVRRRFHTVVDAAGLDEERVRDWVVVRAMHDASWAVQDARRARRTLSPAERDRITVLITVAKAVQ